MTTPTYMIAHGSAAVQAARIIAAVAKEREVRDKSEAKQENREKGGPPAVPPSSAGLTQYPFQSG